MIYFKQCERLRAFLINWWKYTKMIYFKECERLGIWDLARQDQYICEKTYFLSSLLEGKNVKQYN